MTHTDTYIAFMMDHAAGNHPESFAVAGDLHISLSERGAETAHLWSMIGGVMLGLGRALGETMAVTFVIGNAQRMPSSLFSPGTSIASTLANEFGEAVDFHVSTLYALGFLLFVITFVVLAAAKIMLVRAGRAKGF